MTQADAIAERDGPAGGDLVRRHRLSTRIWHWINAITFFIMLMSGLMIFNAHPRLYWGAVRRELRPRLARDRQRRGPRLPADRRAHRRHRRRPRIAGGGRAAAAPRVPGLGDHPLELQPRAVAALAPDLRLGVRGRDRGLRALEPRQRPPAARPAAEAGRARAAPPLAGHQAAREARLSQGRGGAPLQRPAEARLLRGDPRPDPGDGAERAHDVAEHGRQPGPGCSTSSAGGRARGRSTSSPPGCSSPSWSSIWSWWCWPDPSTRSAR